MTHFGIEMTESVVWVRLTWPAVLAVVLCLVTSFGLHWRALCRRVRK